MLPGAVPGTFAGGSAPSTPPPAPPAATPGSPSPIPGVDSYATAALIAKNAYQKSLAQINGNRTTALHQYGYAGDIDPTSGTITNMRVDPNNPYGAFQEMLQSHAQNQQQAHYAAAQRGLSSAGGLGAQGITADHRAFGADSSQLGQSIMAQLQGFQNQQDDASQSRDSALYSAQLQSARDAIANQQFDTLQNEITNLPAYGDYAGDPQYGDMPADGGYYDDNPTDASSDGGYGGGNAPSTSPFVNTAGRITPGARTIKGPALKKIIATATKQNQPISEHGAGQMVAAKPAPKSAPKPAPKPAAKNAYTSGQKKRG